VQWKLRRPRARLKTEGRIISVGQEQGRKLTYDERAEKDSLHFLRTVRGKVLRPALGESLARGPHVGLAKIQRVGVEMTTGVAAKTQVKWQGFVLLMGLFAGLCTIFVLVVTVVEGWQEHAQAQWPVATAHVEKCYLHQSSTGRRDRYYIDCRLSYVVGADEFMAKFYSRKVPSREVSQYPPNQIEPFEQWVEAHPQGTSIEVRYDPSNPNKAVLAATELPLGGPHTPSNVKLLGFLATSCVVLLAIARIARPRTGAVAG
jgi:hypothetical protein